MLIRWDGSFHAQIQDWEATRDQLDQHMGDSLAEQQTKRNDLILKELAFKIYDILLNLSSNP